MTVPCAITRIFDFGTYELDSLKLLMHCQGWKYNKFYKSFKFYKIRVQTKYSDNSKILQILILTTLHNCTFIHK